MKQLRWIWILAAAAVTCVIGLLLLLNPGSSARALMRLLGDHAITNALATGWISVGNLWMMGGLLIAIKKGGWKNEA